MLWFLAPDMSMKVCFTDIDDPIWCLFGCANKVKIKVSTAFMK